MFSTKGGIMKTDTKIWGFLLRSWIGVAAKEQKKLITTPTLVLMIISTIYGFGNVSIAYDQMAYAGMFWYILAGVCFFFPCCLMMAEYGSAFKDAQGGIYSWLAGSIGERLAFIGTFIWLASWVLWLVSSASRLWITLSALLFGHDTTQQWHFWIFNSKLFPLWL